LNNFRTEPISGFANINLTFCKQCRYSNNNKQSARWRAKRSQWLGMTPTARWHAHRHTGGVTGGRGHLYQSRFRSFPIQQDHHFLSVCRYVERNPLRANLVAKAQDWRWSSLWTRPDRPSTIGVLLSPWPVEIPPPMDDHGESGAQ
jgi:REP element-mobilizing transposase RayT